MKQKKYIIILLCISVLIFLAEYFYAAAFHRPASDDFFFMSSVREHGITGGTLLQFSDQNSRFISMLLIHLIISGMMKYKLFFLFTSAVLLIAFTSSMLLLMRAVECRFKVHFTTPLLYALFATAIMFYSGFSTGEIWFWASSIPTYLINSIMIIAGFALLFHRSRRWYVIVSGILCFAYAGNASEISVFVIPLLFVLFFISVRSTPCRNDKWKATVFMLSFSIAALLLFSGKGMTNRIDSVSVVSWSEALWQGFRYSGIIVLRQLPYVIVPVISGIVFLAAILADQQFIRLRKRSILLFITAIAVYIFIFQLIFAFHTRDSAPARALHVPVSLLILSAVVFVSPWIKQRNSHVLKYSTLIVLITFQSIHAGIRIPQTRNYVEHFDSRMLQLKQADNPDTEIMIVEQLPQPGMLYADEITADTSSYQNIHLKLGLQLDFHVIVKNSEDSQ